jgi:GTPase SAR1 family protein
MDSKSYEKVKQMVKRISELQVKKVPLLLFGTKADLKNELPQKVQLSDVQLYATKWSPDLILSVAEGEDSPFLLSLALVLFLFFFPCLVALL